jgi:hypothetical protein
MQGTVKIALRLVFFTLLVVIFVEPVLLANEPPYLKKKVPKKIVIATIVYANRFLYDFDSYSCETNPTILAIHKEVAGIVVKRLQLQGFDVVNLSGNTYSCSGLLPDDFDEIRSSLAKWSREIRIPSAETISDDLGVFSIFIYADTDIDASDEGKSSAFANCSMMAYALHDIQQPGKSRRAIWAKASQTCSSKVFASTDILESVRGDSKLKVKKADVQNARRTCLNKVLNDALSELPRYEPPKNEKQRQ